MKVREVTLHKYLEKLIEKHLPKQKGKIKLKICCKGEPGFSVLYGGFANYEDRAIEIPNWILVDKEEALSTVRHEFAHFLKKALRLPGGNHGKGFKEALRIINPKGWNRDRYWIMSPAISEYWKKNGYRAKARK